MFEASETFGHCNFSLLKNISFEYYLSYKNNQSYIPEYFISTNKFTNSLIDIDRQQKYSDLQSVILQLREIVHNNEPLAFISII